MQKSLMPVVLASALFALAACASMDYAPARERSLGQIASAGCSDAGSVFLVTGQVNNAYENTVVLWDGHDPRSQVAVTLPGRGPFSRVRGWFGQNRYELTAEKLDALAAEHVPVTATLVCQGGDVAPVAQKIAFTDAQGERVAIAY